MKVYYIMQDNGDGSSSALFFKDKTIPERLVNSESGSDLEAYYGNEGHVSSFEIPDGPNTILFSDGDDWLQDDRED